MAKWNKNLTFENLIDEAGGGRNHRWDTDFDTLERSVTHGAVRFHEGGRISIECGFDNNPIGRSIVGGMADEFNVSTIKELREVYLPDGTKIPKTWVDQNYCVVIDYEHNRILNASSGWYRGGRNLVTYAHRDAMPRTAATFRVSIPDRKATARALMELEPQRIAAVAAFRMAEGNLARPAVNGELTRAVKEGDITSSERVQLLAGNYSDDRWKEVVKQAFTTAIQVPYLLPKPFGKK